jgi:prepilin-type N-terminal cleavage/methylation domain-containing protein
MRRSAFTLIELLVAIGIASLLAATLFQLFSTGVKGSYRLTERTSAEQDVRLALQAMSQEIEEGSRIFFPAPGETRDGVGFVNARGEPIVYYHARFEERARDGKPVLRRANLLDAKGDEVVVESVMHFRVTTPKSESGRPPGAVNLDLAVGSRIDGVDANVLTSVALRALDRRAGDEPDPSPSPAPGAR